MRKLITFLAFCAFITSSGYLGAQDCPLSNLRKNSSCIIVTYQTVGEAQLAVATPEVLTITMSTGGSADGTYTASTVCTGAEVVFTKNGSSSCNCNGYNGETAGEFEFVEAGITCIYNADGTLPVELASFSGKREGDFIMLEWSTLSETENEGFFLESSKDGKTWEPIGFLKGVGNTTVPTAYKTLDRKPNEGYNYYRLKQVDFNGNYTYSDVISINYRDEGILDYRFDVLSALLNIESDVSFSEISLYNVSGNRLKVWRDIDKISSLSVGSIESGTYIVVFKKSNGLTSSGRFVKF